MGGNYLVVPVGRIDGNAYFSLVAGQVTDIDVRNFGFKAELGLTKDRLRGGG
jgi:hypothetical protein